jgi:hypothetical protein
MTPMMTWETGRRTREAVVSCSEESSWKNSSRGMTSIWFAEDIKWWKMVTVSLERTSNWLQSFQQRIIAVISTTTLPWWTWTKTSCANSLHLKVTPRRNKREGKDRNNITSE